MNSEKINKSLSHWAETRSENKIKNLVIFRPNLAKKQKQFLIRNLRKNIYHSIMIPA